MERPLNNDLNPILPIFHEILRLVENDENNYRKGCDWAYVKKNAKESSIINSKDGFIKILSDSGKHTLEFLNKKAIASSFLVRFRDAFAHNYITYNTSKKIIEVDLSSNFNNEKVLKGTISESAFREFVKLIKESKVTKTNSESNN